MTIGDAITHGEAATILGYTTAALKGRLRNGQIHRNYPGRRKPFSREIVEAIALVEWTPTRHQTGGYWATTAEAKNILAVSGQYIGRLTKRGDLPGRMVRVHGRAHWLYRREQIEIIPNGRRQKATKTVTPVVHSPQRT